MWIEIGANGTDGITPQSYPARGMWIEIAVIFIILMLTDRRTPRGVCGLKFVSEIKFIRINTSYPARGMWIEIILGMHCTNYL